MENQSLYDIGSFYSCDRRVEITPEYVMHLKKKAILQLESKLARHEPKHAAIIAHHVLAYLSTTKPSKTSLFETYLVEIEELNALRLKSRLSPLTPIAGSTFGKLAKFTPVLKLACRESIRVAQATVRLSWDGSHHPVGFLSDNGTSFMSPVSFVDAIRSAPSASQPTA